MPSRHQRLQSSSTPVLNGGSPRQSSTLCLRRVETGPPRVQGGPSRTSRNPLQGCHRSWHAGGAGRVYRGSSCWPRSSTTSRSSSPVSFTSSLSNWDCSGDYSSRGSGHSDLDLPQMDLPLPHPGGFKGQLSTVPTGVPLPTPGTLFGSRGERPKP